MASLATVANTTNTIVNPVNFGVTKVQKLGYDGDNHQLTTKVYHGVSIVSGAGVVGRIQSWQPDAYTREGVHLYELSSNYFGRPVEYIPGRATGFTIAVTRAEVWGSEMEKAFGFDATFDDLTDQVRPFQVNEFWIKGSESTSEVWTYSGCWFQNKNYDAITSDGDGVTRVTATLAYVSRHKYSSAGPA